MSVVVASGRLLSKGPEGIVGLSGGMVKTC